MALSSSATTSRSSRIASQPAARRARNSPRVFRCHALDPKLDAALNKVLEAAVEREPLFRDLKRVPHEKIASEINDLLAMSKELGTNKITKSLNEGSFEGILTTDLRSISADSSTTLGRLSFNQFAPKDLKVNLASDAAQALTGLPEQLKGEWEGAPNKYIVHSHFSFEDTSGETILGFTTAIAEFEYPGPKDSTERLPIKFTGYRIAPADPDNQLQQWLAMLKAGNSMMDDNGVAAVAFDPAMPAHLDYVMMSEQYQVSRGNLGSVVITKRVG